jgi:hypothetical protein
MQASESNAILISDSAILILLLAGCDFLYFFALLTLHLTTPDEFTVTARALSDHARREAFVAAETLAAVSSARRSIANTS